MKRYRRTEGGVMREDGAFVPEAPGNRDWEAYQVWLVGGNTPDPAEVPPPEKVSAVTMRQARLQLLKMGLLQEVSSAIDALPGAEGETARIEWEYASTVDRGNATTAALLAQLQLSEEEIDDLFAAASLL